MVVDAVAEHPLLSVRLMVYVPAISPVLVEFVPPPDQEYVYGEVPPVGVDETLPVLPPQQFTFAVVVAETLNTEGWVMVAVPGVGEPHPFASVTNTLYVPAVNPVKVEFVPPDGDQ